MIADKFEEDKKGGGMGGVYETAAQPLPAEVPHGTMSKASTPGVRAACAPSTCTWRSGICQSHVRRRFALFFEAAASLDKPPPCPENRLHHAPNHHPKGFSGAGWRYGCER